MATTTLIWIDTSVSIPHGNLFRISGGTGPNGESGVFYQGLAVSPSGFGNVPVYINRICATRMVYGTPNFRARTRAACCIPQTFIVERSADNGSTWTTVNTFTFWPDWTYRETALRVWRNARINDHFHPMMALFCSNASTSGGSVRPFYTRANGNTTKLTAISLSGGGTASFTTPGTAASDIVAVGFDGMTASYAAQYQWKTLNRCAPGALYYRNALGGWESFLIEGAIVPTDEQQRWTRGVAIDNSGLPGTVLRGEQNYVTETTHRWDLTTGALTDDEARLLAAHLLPSCDVWLHLFATDEIVPVILDTSSQRIGTYSTNGRRPVTFAMGCHLAQKRISM